VKALTQEERKEWIRQLSNSVDDLNAYLTIKPEPKDAEEIRWRLTVQELALAALTAEPVAVPEGWKLVPVEPTMGQLIAGRKAINGTGKMSHLMQQRLSYIYRAMLATAPTP
jgi:hypothetical protein